MLCGAGVERLCIEAPEVVSNLHKAYISAGADIITTNSFCATVSTLGKDKAVAICKAAATIARKAAADAIFVAGSIGPGDDAAGVTLRARALTAGGADLILLETMTSVNEAVEALRACADVGKPVIVAVALGADGKLISGESVAHFCSAVAPFHPLAAGVNCCPPAMAAECVDLFAARGLPVILLPSAGIPDRDGHYPVGPAEFARLMAPLAKDRRVAFVGGCCGTTPGHISRLCQDARCGQCDV